MNSMTKEEILVQLREQRGTAQLQVNKLNELIGEVQNDIEIPKLERLLGKCFVSQNPYLTNENWNIYYKVIGIVNWETVKKLNKKNLINT